VTTPPNNQRGGTSVDPKPNVSLKPILITLLSSVVLAGGSCYGYAGGSGSGANMFAAGFIVGVLAFVTGLIWLLVVFAREAVRNSR
jgi:hypothetical protein